MSAALRLFVALELCRRRAGGAGALPHGGDGLCGRRLGVAAGRATRPAPDAGLPGLARAGGRRPGRRDRAASPARGAGAGPRLALGDALLLPPGARACWARPWTTSTATLAALHGAEVRAAGAGGALRARGPPVPPARDGGAAAPRRARPARAMRRPRRRRSTSAGRRSRCTARCPPARGRATSRSCRCRWRGESGAVPPSAAPLRARLRPARRTARAAHLARPTSRAPARRRATSRRPRSRRPLRAARPAPLVRLASVPPAHLSAAIIRAPTPCAQS